jgi:Putative zinc-finger
MNCKQILELLPLSVGHDLEEKRERMVAAHLQSCLECFAAAKEFRETRQLLREYGSPAISQDVYAELRGRVLREIQAKSTRLSLPQIVASLFRPRLAWALASVLIVVLVLAIYLTASRREDEPLLANNPATVQPNVNRQPDQGSLGDKQAGPSTHQTRVNNKRWIEVRRFQPKKSRDLINDRSTQVTAVSSQRNLAEPALFRARDAAASEKTLRMEIQTKDPNIRIIWFAQPKTKAELRSSKGI